MPSAVQGSGRITKMMDEEAIPCKDGRQSLADNGIKKDNAESSTKSESSGLTDSNDTSGAPTGLGVDLASLCLANESHVEANDSPDGLYKSNTTQRKGLTPGSGTRRSYGRLGSSGSGHFIQRGKQATNDDPFANTPSRGSQRYHGSNRQQSNDPSPVSAARTSANWRTSSSGSDESPKQVNRKLFQNDKPKSPEGTIDPKNAQAIFPPSACVFVANLLQTEDEQQLEYAVTKIFKDYGHVFVKIRRDARNMPFAFCQFTTDEAADRAVEEGRGRVIHGRPCRTERAKANRVYILTRRNGKFVANEEAEELTSRFGEIDEVSQITEAEQVAQRLEQGCFVKFKYYENGRDASSALRDHHEFRLVQQTHTNFTPVRVESARRPTHLEAKSYLDRYDVDRRSIFVGNLPQNIQQEQLQERFGRFGAVRKAEVIRRRSNREGCEENVFGFVEFFDPTVVQQAHAEEHNAIFCGNRIRVVPKNSDHNNRDIRPVRRSNQEHAANTYGSPQHITAIEPSMSPQYYPSPYGYMTGYPPTPMYSSGYSAYAQSPYPQTPAQYAPGYSPPTYFSGSPNYSTRTVGHENVGVSASPSSYYQYPSYQYPAADYYAPQGMNSYQMGYVSPYVATQDHQVQYAQALATDSIPVDVDSSMASTEKIDEILGNKPVPEPSE